MARQLRTVLLVVDGESIAGKLFVVLRIAGSSLSINVCDCCLILEEGVRVGGGEGGDGGQQLLPGQARQGGHLAPHSTQRRPVVQLGSRR